METNKLKDNAFTQVNYINNALGNLCTFAREMNKAYSKGETAKFNSNLKDVGICAKSIIESVKALQGMGFTV